MVDAKFRSRVKIKTFTGRRSDYLAGPIEPKDVKNRDHNGDFSQIDWYYKNASKVPVAWRECWTDLQSHDFGYNRVVLFYNCCFWTKDEKGQERRWQAMAVFMYDNQIINLLLISTAELLMWLWQYNHPRYFEYRAYFPKFGDNDQDKYILHPVREYIEEHGVEISEKFIPVGGLNDQSCYDGDLEELLDVVGRELEIPQCGTLRPGQLHLFRGLASDFEANMPEPMIFRHPGEFDFTEVDAYCEAHSIRPAIWCRLWTNLRFDYFGLNYNHVVMLNRGNFVSVGNDRGEESWQGAVVFMHDDVLLDVLLVKTNDWLDHLYSRHPPTCFEFTDRSIRSFAYQPLKGYLDGSLTEQKVEISTISVDKSPLREMRFLMDQAGINALGVALRQFVLEENCPRKS